MTTAKPKKRGYARDFSTKGKTTAFYLSDIPADLWTRVRKKAARDGISMRTLILHLLTIWLARNLTADDTLDTPD